MRGCRFARAALGSFVFAGALQAQTPGRIDFGRDVLPILRQNCVTCHSGTQPASGMRLDRKSAVINRRGIVPGSAENSFLFHRISGNDYGMQMPPTGALNRNRSTPSNGGSSRAPTGRTRSPMKRSCHRSIRRPSPWSMRCTRAIFRSS